MTEQQQEQYIMAIDEGTTSARAIIIDKEGNFVGSSQREFRQIFPHDGWVEHDANEIWNAVQSVIAGAFIESRIQPKQIAGIGITNQRETTVVWDKETGIPIYNAIVWQSRQSNDICDILREQGHQELIRSKTGLTIDPYFSGTKIRWILDHVDGAQERAENGELLFGTIDTWLSWKLSGGELHITDYSNASRTMLLNLETQDWDDEILEILNIPKAMLPELVSNSDVYGTTKNYHFFGEEVPIAGMVGDQQSALIGQLAFDKGMVKSTYGTGAFIVMNMGQDLKLSENQLLTTVAYKIGDEITYALEGSIFVAGSAIQWLRDGIEIVENSADTEQMAYDSNNDDEVYMVPAFTGLGAPYWNPNARGSMFGVTRATTRNDIAKATLQSLAYQVRDIIDTMEADSGIEIPVLKVDGGAARNEYLMQFQADISGKEISRVANLETTALGAAYMAGLAVGFWDSIEDIRQMAGETTDYQSQMNDSRKEELYDGWKRAVKATQVFADKSE
ncbi:glycerol kinase GlpK [Aerococcaceae bacterium DSM 111022]|nr:glycerol kinase GlpK [Aerococcaceae bacterium DSM 111022]